MRRLCLFALGCALGCAPQEGPIDASGEGFAAFIGEPDTQYELIPEGLPVFASIASLAEAPS